MRQAKTDRNDICVASTSFWDARSINAVCLFFSIFFLVASTVVVWAEDFVLNCEQFGVSPKRTFILTYTGQGAGTLSIKAPFGDVTLPATKRIGTHAYVDNQHATITEAYGATNALMPDPGAIEACIAIQKNPDNDPDIASTNAMICENDTPDGPTAVAIMVSAKITTLKLGDDTLHEVTITRSYPDPSTTKIEAILKCK